MEFKDRVANKPNRVKLTYEDGGASAYATVELADEPIEEGTPLNAENMNKLLNKENNDYIVEQGTSGIWTYRKWASGIAECWGKKIASVITSSTWAGYYTGAIGSINFPTGLFISAPILNVTLKASNFPGHIYIDGYESASETSVISIAGHDQRTVESHIHLNAKGRWK